MHTPYAIDEYRGTISFGKRIELLGLAFIFKIFGRKGSPGMILLVRQLQTWIRAGESIGESLAYARLYLPTKRKTPRDVTRPVGQYLRSQEEG
jgi:hypothetical protein